MISLRLITIAVLAAGILTAAAVSADEIGRDQEIFNQGKVLSSPLPAAAGQGG